MTPNLQILEGRLPDRADVVALYRANAWSSAERADELMAALAHSHSLVTAWDGSSLVGLGNAISDGHLVVYYLHVLVLPQWQGKGVGKAIMRCLQQRYEGFHQQILVADGASTEFYRNMGFERAGRTVPMWVYAGKDH